ncbi:hypothetical protein D3C84_552050 [compost metagenome]
MIRRRTRQAFQGKRRHQALRSWRNGLGHRRFDLAFFAAQQLFNHGGQAGDGHLVIAQLVFAVADKGVAHLDNADLLLAQQQFRALVIHHPGRLHHQVDIHRRARHMERAQTVVAQRVTLVVQSGTFEKRLEPGNGERLQRHHRAFEFRGVVQVNRLAIGVPDQAHLQADPLKGPLWREQIERSGNPLGRGGLADDHRFAQRPRQLTEKRTRALFTGLELIDCGLRGNRCEQQCSAQANG